MAYEPTRHDRGNLSRYGNNNVPNNTGTFSNNNNFNNTFGNNFNNANNSNNNNANFGGYGGGGSGSQGGGEQIRDILHVVFKRKGLIGILFGAVAIPGIVATALQQPSYLASAKVIISTQRSNATLQPTDLTRLEDLKLNESLVNSEVHVIKSRDLLDQVVRAIAREDRGPVSSASDNESKSFGQQVIALGNRLEVTPVKASNVIRIDYSSASPEYAARVVNRVVDQYLGYHAVVHGSSTRQLPRFYEERQRDLESELRAAEKQLLDYSYRTGMVSPKEEIVMGIQTVTSLSAVVRELSLSAAGQEERIRVLRDQIGEQPELVKQSQSLEVNPVVAQLSTHLLDRQVDRVTLLRKYTDEDRLVRDNGEEIASIREQLQSEVRERPTVVTNEQIRLNPLRENLVRELLDREGELKSVRARQATVEEEKRLAAARVVQLKSDAMEYDRLQQLADHKRATFDLYVRKAQEAEISKAMDEQRLANVEVVQRPALPLPRSDTNRVTTSLSLIAGLLVGIAGAFGREYMSRTLRSEYDTQRHLGLPLLASIGEFEE